MQALKESKRQPGTRGSSEGTGTIPGVPNESTFISTTSSKGTGTKPGVPDEEKDITEENIILDWGSEQESEYSKEDKLDDEENDDKEGDVDDEDDETGSDEDDIYKNKIRMRKDEDEEMINAEVDDSGKGEEEVTDAAKADAEKTLEVKDDAKKTELPPTISSLSESSVQESPSNATVTTVPPPFVFTTPSVPQQTTTSIPTPTITTDIPIITTIVSQSDALSAVQLRVAKLEKDQILELPKKQTPRVDLKQESEKTPFEIIKIKKEQAEKQKMSKFTIKSNKKEALKVYGQKSALYQTMHANKSFNKKHANHRLYHALMEALIEDENEMDKGVADTVQDHKRKHDNDEDNDDEDPPAGPNQGKKTKRRRTKESESSKQPPTTKETPKGKAPSKGFKIGKSASANEPVEAPIAELVMDDASDDVVHDDDQPQDASEPKASNLEYIELEYHLQECFNTLTNRLDWNNPERDRYPFYLSKPLPLQGHPGHLTIVIDYFFNNDLEYLKSSDLKSTYTTSITKTKAARYEIEGFKDMVPTLLSPTKVGDIVDIIVALRMFTRTLIIKKRVEDLQIGVESYQKKINITSPQQIVPEIEFKESYTPSHKPLGVIYEDLVKQK
uniref:Uncharacterized protein n=1 Tax=Tanacetum cinerariifolium TaxID=118510 RepID=A0A699GKZ9_TANCI|nr:hypothetical protein [Tanacetum cinerariifolium]